MRLTKRAKRRVLFVLAVLMLGTAAVYTIRAVQAAQRERLRAAERELGLAAFERGDMQKALDHLKIAVQYGRDDLDVIVAFAEARATIPMPNRAHLHESRVYYEHALDLVEGDESLEDREERIAAILLELLHVRGQLGEFIEMERVADRILADEPANIDALTAKVTTAMRDRRFEDAMPQAQRLAELQPDDLRWRHLQLQIMHGSRIDDAELIARCDEWVAGYAGDGRMHLLKAAWLFELGWTEDAQREIEVAVEEGAGSLAVLEQMLSLLSMVERHDLIATTIQRTRELYAEAPWARHAIVFYAWRTGQMPEALEELERAQAELGELPLDLKRDRVLVLIGVDRIDEARSAVVEYRAAVAAVPPARRKNAMTADAEMTRDADRAIVLALETWLGSKPRPWSEMIQRFDEALAIAPDEPIVHYLKGQLLARGGEYALAAASFERAEALDPIWTAASVAHADSLYALGRIEEAFEVARAAARRAPRNNLSPLMSMARAAIQLNRLPRYPNEVTPIFDSEERFAIESARRAAAGMDLPGLMTAIHNQLRTNPEAFALLIESLMQTGRASEAESAMRDWLAQESLGVEQLVAAADLVRRHDLGAVQDLERRLRDDRSGDARVPVAHAWLVADRGEAERGVEILERFFAEAPPEVAGNDLIQLARVSFSLETGQPNAWEQVRELVQQFPNSVPVQSFALGQPRVWEDRPFVEQVIGHLTKSLGERSQQVRLARASYLLKYESQSDEELARAVVLIHGILEETPTSLMALTLLADAYMKGRQPMPEQATEALRTAVDAHQHEVSLYPRLIALLQQLGQYDEAQRYLAQLARLNPTDPQIARAEVQLLFSQGDFQRALVRASTFIDEEQAPPSDLLLLAVVHDRSGNVAEAESIFTRLLEDPAADDTVRTQAAEFYARHDQFDRGVKLLGSALADESEGTRRVMLGWFCYRHGREVEARTHFDEAVRVEPDSADGWHALARFHMANQRYADAEHVAGEGLQATNGEDRLRADLALAVAGASGQPWREALCRLALQASDVTALLATLELAASIDESLPDSVQSDELPLAPGQLEAARALLEQHPRFMPAWYLAIALHANSNQMAAATEFARSAMSRFPNRPEPAEWALRLFMQAGRWNEAVSAGEEWVARTSDDALPAHCAVALAMMNLDRAKSAVERLRPFAAALVEQRNVRPENAIVLVDAMLAAGDFDGLMSVAAPMLLEQAWRLRWAASARTVNPAVTARVLMELQEHATGNIEGSEPATPQELIMLAAEWQQLAERTGDHQWLERATALAESVQGSTDDVALQSTAEFVRATIEETRGNPQEAEQRYRNVIAARPDHALAMNNLAHLLWRQNSSNPEALALARRAVELMPGSPDLLDTLGMVLLSTGQSAEAETHLRKALAARPMDINIGLNLVDAILHQNRFQDASRELELLQRTMRRLPGGGEEFQQRMQQLQERIREHLTLAQPARSTQP